MKNVMMETMIQKMDVLIVSFQQKNVAQKFVKNVIKVIVKSVMMATI